MSENTGRHMTLTRPRGDYYEAEKTREAAEIDATPATERQEIRHIYAAKGFAGGWVAWPPRCTAAMPIARCLGLSWRG
jgi:hypothetical protein